MSIKKRVREILEVAHTGDWASRWFDWFLISLISINVILGSSFLEQIQRRREHETRICPHCGEEVHE